MAITRAPVRRREPGLSTWNPFNELDSMLQRFNRLVGAPVGDWSSREEAGVAWAPVVDIVETDNDYQVQAEIPGIKREDVSVEVCNGVLTISGERKREEESGEPTHHRIERSYGSFLRSFTLPDDADEEALRAQFADGVLTVTAPKRAGASTDVRRVQVEG